MMHLHPWQRQCITDFLRFGGCFVAMGVGAGKTTMAASLVAKCERPAVLAPARGLPQIREMFHEAHLPPEAFRSHTRMCLSSSDGWLEEYAPTDIVVDEAHMLKNISTNTAARRLNRYLIANPRVRVCWMTGTPISRSLADCVHGLRFALRSRAPLPTSREGIARFVELVDSSEVAQQEFYADLRARPGVFIDTAPSYDGVIELTVVDRKPALVLDDDAGWWERGPAAWGARYRCVPPIPDALRLARRNWNRQAGYLIDAGACDTEAQARLIRPELYAVYVHGEDQCDYEQVVEWEDDAALRETLSDVGPGTLVWAHHRAVQERTARILGCTREPGGDVAVLSMQGHSTVLNLQQYHTNLILEPSPDAALMSQLIGRTARQGQRAPVVRVQLVCAWPGARKALRAAITRAILIRNSTGNGSPLLQLEKDR